MYRHVRLASAGMLLLALVAALAPAGPAAGQRSAPLDDLYTQLGVDQVSAHYVILVDTSLSMKEANLYAGVRESLRQFFAALAPDDTLTLVSVAEVARLIWEGKAGATPDDIAAKLPPAPTGRYTDLGRGIEAAVDALEKRPGQPIAGVVLLTDGEHDPAPASRYPFTQGFAWQQLARRAERLTQQVASYAIQLRGVNGAATLTRVFPGTRLVRTAAIDQLAARLAEPKAAVKAAKARNLLADDSRPSIVVEWPATLGAGTVSVRLRSTSTRLPLEVSDIVVLTESPGLRVEVARGTFLLAPGASTTVPVTVRWDALPPSWRPVHTVRRPYQLRLNGTIRSSWSPLLAEIGLVIEPSLAGTEADGTALDERGSLRWWLTAAAVLVALLLLGMRLRWLRLHPVPGGTLVATPLDRGPAGGSAALRSRRVPILATTLKVPGAGWVSGRRRGLRSKPVLAIEYSRDGSAAGRTVAECPAGGAVDVHGVRFEWRR